MSSGTIKAENRQAEKIAANNCRQRQLYFTFMAGSTSINNIKNRYNGPVSPYPQFTKAQLDMRRKAEILQYPQQSYVLTKAKTWRNLVQAPNRYSCPDNIVKYVPTSSSDVPGPVILLQNNPNIPLYNYAPMLNYQNPLSVVAYPPLTQTWSSFPEFNQIFNQNTYATVSNLVIVSPNSTNYNFTIQIPVSLSISGYVSMPSSSILSVYVSSISFEVYYSDVLINTKPIIINNFSNLDISLNNITGQFQATSYVGQLIISNLNLLTVPQYVYTFKLKFNLGYTSTIPLIISSLALSAICNLLTTNDPNYNQTTNCINLSLPDNSKFHPYKISGVETIQ